MQRTARACHSWPSIPRDRQRTAARCTEVRTRSDKEMSCRRGVYCPCPLLPNQEQFFYHARDRAPLHRTRQAPCPGRHAGSQGPQRQTGATAARTGAVAGAPGQPGGHGAIQSGTRATQRVHAHAQERIRATGPGLLHRTGCGAGRVAGAPAGGIPRGGDRLDQRATRSPEPALPQPRTLDHRGHGDLPAHRRLPRYRGLRRRQHGLRQ
ncbi:hypothetical protein D3C75_896880 [compost metagenome]